MLNHNKLANLIKKEKKKDMESFFLKVRANKETEKESIKTTFVPTHHNNNE